MIKDIGDTPAWDEQKVATITEQMRQLLNEVVTECDLSSTEVLVILSRLSAAYIHAMQRIVDDPEEAATAEDVFHALLQHHLAAFDVRDVQREVEKIRNERLN